jgi:Flp pilus assembly protein TadD
MPSATVAFFREGTMKLPPYVAAAAIICWPAPAAPQVTEQTPAACRPSVQGRIDYKACAAVAPVGSPIRGLALINLGTEAFTNRNFAEAVRLYDEAVPPGQQLASDVRFHAFRASAYDHVGRTEEAGKDARLALDMLNGKPGPAGQVSGAPGEAAMVYELILPILKRRADPGFPAALAAYRSIPATDWVDWVNRAGVLEQLGELQAALAANTEALKLNASHPAVLNNQCYILTRGGDAAGAMPYCQKAVAGAPNEPSVRHSYASALAAAGRCTEANAELEIARRLDPSSATYKQTLACKAS